MCRPLAAQGPVDCVAYNDDGEILLLDSKQDASRVNPGRKVAARIHRPRSPLQKLVVGFILFGYSLSWIFKLGGRDDRSYFLKCIEVADDEYELADMGFDQYGHIEEIIFDRLLNEHPITLGENPYIVKLHQKLERCLAIPPFGGKYFKYLAFVVNRVDPYKHLFQGAGQFLTKAYVFLLRISSNI